MADSIKSDVRKGLASPHARPWLAVAGQVPATFAAHLAWGDDPTVAIGMTLAAGALTAATWWAGKNTSEARRIHATLTTAAATGYLTTATFTDPLGSGQLTWLALGGGALAASWNVRKVLRTNPDTTETDASETGLLTKSLGKAKAKLRGEPTVEANKVTAKYQLAPGELTNTDLGTRLSQIASELGVSPNSIRIKADPENAGRGELVLTPTDMLKTPTPWPGPSHAGGSITDPVIPGIYEDGAEAQLWFPSDHKTGRNATHFLTAGMNGSGKSAGVSVAIAEVLTRRDVIVWAVDPSKGKQTFAPFLPFLDWVEMSSAGGEDMIDALGQVITARADALGEHGFKNWTPDAHRQLGMPYMVVWIEEAAKFFREGTEMEGLVMEARSAGISVIISLQRPSATSMPTDVREQLGGVLCFGVKGGTTADMALPDDVRDAGARPEAWENRKPGYAYLVAPGVDEERYPTPLRTYTSTDQQITAELAGVERAVADPVTAAAAGDAYANRTHHTPDPTTQKQEQPMPTNTPTGNRDAQNEALLERQINRDIDARLPNDEGGPDADELGADPDRELPPISQTTVWKFATADPTPEKTPDDATAELLAMLDEYRAEGLEHIGPKHFQPYGREGRIGRSRAWISARLNDLADDNIHLAETDDAGVYQLLYPTPAHAAA